MNLKHDYSKSDALIADFLATRDLAGVAAKYGFPYRTANNLITRRVGRIRKRVPVNDLPEVLPPIPARLLTFKAPITAEELHRRRLEAEVSQSPCARRAEAGEGPLAPFHPIALAALPRLLSLEQR